MSKKKYIPKIVVSIPPPKYIPTELEVRKVILVSIMADLLLNELPNIEQNNKIFHTGYKNTLVKFRDYTDKAITQLFEYDETLDNFNFYKKELFDRFKVALTEVEELFNKNDE